MLHLIVVSPIRKEKKRNINNDLAILPSHDMASNNFYSVLHPEKLGNKINSTNTTKKVRDI